MITGKNALFHQLLIFCAAWTSFMKMAAGEKMHDGLAVISILFGILLILYAVCRLQIPQAVYLIWIIFALSGMLNIIAVGNLYWSVFMSMLFSYIPIALNLVYAPRLDCSFWKANYLAAGIYMLYRMITSPDGVVLFGNLSRNNLSVLLLAWLVIYALALKKSRHEIPLWTVLFYAACCIVAVGRFGIFTACLMAAGFWMFHFFYQTHHGLWVQKKFLFGMLGIVAGLLLFACMKNLLIRKIFARFAEMGFAGSSDRIGMVMDYFHKWNSISAVLLGADRTQIPSIVLRSGNPHNSYIFMHMYFGMPGFLILIAGGFFIIRFLYRKKQFDMLILALGYFLRILTDSVFPGSFGGDTAFWIFLFYMIQKDKIKSNSI